MKIFDLNLGIGLPRRQQVDVLAHVAQADGIDRGHSDLDIQLIVGIANGHLQVLILLDQPLTAFVIGLAQRGEPKWTDRAIDQLHAQPSFQLQDNLAGSGL